ncbi:hypothetical protein SESBI_12486 [Sesbania bispinosa]|nr:hypothetical protein SESBI_12486 [Sesbania bispinosa]
MPPRQRPYHEIEMEKLRRQLQQLQATVEIQQAQIEEQIRCFEEKSDESDSHTMTTITLGNNNSEVVTH